MRHRLRALIPLVVGAEVPPGLVDLDTGWRVPAGGDEAAVILGSLRQRAYAAHHPLGLVPV
jgi:hypothetical protein